MRRRWAALALSLVMLPALGGCAFVDLLPLGPGPDGDTEDYQPRPEELIVPDRIRIVPDDYNTQHVGSIADGRHVFLHATFCGEETCLATFYWNADGSFDELTIEPVSDDADLWLLLDERFKGLDGAVLEPIVVAPFSQKHEQDLYGFVPYLPDPEYPGDIASVILEPANNVAYYWPWSGEEYDT